MHAATTTLLIGSLILGSAVAPEATAQQRVVLPHHTVAADVRSGGCTGGEDIAQTWTNNATALNEADNPAIGQSLTAPCTGNLEVISFTVAALVTPGALRLDVHQGAGDGGAILGTAPVNVQAPGVYTVDLPQPIAVSEGTVYTFKLSIAAGQATSATIADWWGGGTGERYPGGTEYNVAFGGGGTFFGPDPEYDLTFGADFEPPEAGCDVVQLQSDGAVDLNTSFNPALGQSFTAQCDGLIRSISFWVWTVDEPGPLLMTLHAGAGDAGPVLGSGVVQVDTTGVHTVMLAPAIPAALSGVYTFKLTVPAGQATAVNLEEHAQNPYAGGMEYNVAYAGGGTSFAGDPQYDLAFSVDIDFASAAEGPAPDDEYRLLAAIGPNPVDREAAVSLRLPDAQVVRVSVLDALGRLVGTIHDGPLAAGAHTLRWDTSALPSGVYVIQALSGDRSESRRVVVR